MSTLPLILVPLTGATDTAGEPDGAAVGEAVGSAWAGGLSVPGCAIRLRKAAAVPLHAESECQACSPGPPRLAPSQPEVPQQRPPGAGPRCASPRPLARARGLGRWAPLRTRAGRQGRGAAGGAGRRCCSLALFVEGWASPSTRCDPGRGGEEGKRNRAASSRSPEPPTPAFGEGGGRPGLGPESCKKPCDRKNAPAGRLLAVTASWKNYSLTLFSPHHHPDCPNGSCGGASGADRTPQNPGGAGGRGPWPL